MTKRIRYSCSLMLKISCLQDNCCYIQKILFSLYWATHKSTKIDDKKNQIMMLLLWIEQSRV